MKRKGFEFNPTEEESVETELDKVALDPLEKPKEAWETEEEEEGEFVEPEEDFSRDFLPPEEGES